MPAAAAAQEFPAPRAGTVIHFRPMNDADGKTRQRLRITRVDGSLLSAEVESGEITMRYLVMERGPAGENCRFVKAGDGLDNLAVGTQVLFELLCDNPNGTQATVKIRRSILRKQQVRVPVGTFDTVLIEDVAEAKTFRNGTVQATENTVDRYWFTPSIGFYVRRVSWNGIEPPENPQRWDLAVLQTASGAPTAVPPQPQVRTEPPAAEPKTAARPNANDAPEAKPQAKPAPKRTAAKPKPAPRRQRADADGESAGPPALNCQNPAQWSACANRALSTLPAQ